MKVTNKTVIELTMQELKQYALRALEAQGQIPDNPEYELIVVDESPGVGVWISVPEDWDKESCPDYDLTRLDKIEVKFRNGKTEICSPFTYEVCWRQENNEWDIIKCRGISKTR